MKITCDTCGRTARGTADELIDLEWSWVIVRAPFRRTFRACRYHGREMSIAVVSALTCGDEPEMRRIARLFDEEVERRRKEEIA